MENTNQRTAYFDVLRVVSTLAVVVLHLSAQFWADIDVTSRAWFAYNLYNSAVRWAVPVFVMISGALFLSRDISLSLLLRKYILRILTAFVFWSALYAIRGFYVYGTPLSDSLIIFVQGHYHMWFLFMIAGLYLLVPLLRCFVLEERLMKYFLLLAVVFGFLLPQCASLLSLVHPRIGTLVSTVLQLSYMKLPLGFPIYFVGGYYLSKRGISHCEETILYAMGIVSFVFTVLISWKLSLLQGAPNGDYYSFTTLNVLFMSIAVFIFAKQHLSFSGIGEAFRKTLFALSKYSFGAYLVHAMVIEILNDHFGLNVLSGNAFFSIPLLAVLVFVLSLGISALLHRVPFVKKFFV